MLVVTPVPLISGSVIQCRPLGILKMVDDGGPDPKIIAVPIDTLTRLYRDMQNCTDLQQDLRDRITHFYEHYKDLEPGKWVRIEGWNSPEDARDEITASIDRFKAAPVKPRF